MLLQVLARLPGLRMLDGQEVGATELRAAPSTVRHEAAVMALMLANACLAHKLVSCQHRATYDFHAEFQLPVAARARIC